MLTIGWNLGHRWRLALYLMRTYTVPVALVIVLVAVAYFVVRLAIKRHLDARLQTAPGEVTSVQDQGDHDLLEV